MSTGDAYVNLALKRFLSQNRMSANFLDYSVGITRDGISRIFPASGLFTYPASLIQNGAGSTFDVSPDPTEGIDNAGHVLILEGASRCTNIPYENTVGEDYWVALKYIEGPEGITVNTRTGTYEYDKWLEEVGEKENPDSIVDNGDTTLTAVVDSLFPDGVSHAGRSVTIWLINPMSADESVAIETRTVVWDGVNNKITTAGDLGQSTISTTNTDYYVACYGVSTYNAGATPSANPYTAEYCILGFITGGNPGSNDTSDQNDLSGGGGHTLDKAYDGLAGSGSGRTVTVDANAVLLQQGSTSSYSHDVNAAALRIRKDASTALPGVGFEYEGALDITQRLYSRAAVLTRVPLADFTGTDLLRIEEAIAFTGGSDIVNFTRGGALDLNLAGNVGQIYTDRDVLEVMGSSLGQDGVYIIHAIGGPGVTLQLRNSDGSVPTFALEAGLTGRIYRELIGVGDSPIALNILPVNDFLEDYLGVPAATAAPSINITVPTTVDDSDTLVTIYRDGTAYMRYEAGGDFNLSGKFFMDTGDIQVNVGDVLVIAGDFSYGPFGQSFEMRLGPEDGSPEFDTATDNEPEWLMEWNTGIIALLSQDVGKKVAFPLRLPDGCTLTRVRSLVNPGGALAMELEVWKTNHDYVTPAVDVAPTSLGSDTTTTSSVEILDVSGIGETIDNTTNRYYIVIESGQSADRIYDILVNFDCNEFRPMAA